MLKKTILVLFILAYSSINAQNDPLLSNQWNLSKIRATDAWSISTGSPSIIIAILDAGVDSNHPDLQYKLVTGYDVADNDNTTNPYGNDYHGTACAGLAAAHTNNGLGIAGVGYNCKIMPIQLAHSEGLIGNAANFVTGLNWAVAHGADVISFSGHTETSQAVIDALYNAKINGRNGKGCVIIKSAGNESGSGITYPGRQPIVLSVGATDQNDQRISDSSYGPELDVMAPSEVYTTDISGSSGFNSGDYKSDFLRTSAAAPQVAGVAGLMLAADNSLTEETVRKIICYTADDINSPGFDNETGWGRINALNAVKSASKQFTLSGNLSNNQCWWGNVTINGNVYVPSGMQLTIISNTTLNFGSFSILSTGGRIIIEGSLPVVCLKEGNEIKSIFGSVQAACNNAQDYQTVEIQTGTFTENVSVSGKTNFRLEGKGPANSIIDGSLSFTNMTYPSIQSLKVRNPNGAYLNEIHFTNCENPSTYNLEGEGGSGTDYMVWAYNCPDLDLTFKSQNASVGFLVQGSYGNLSYSDIRNNGQGVGVEEYSSIGIEYTNFCGNTQNYYADQTSSVSIGASCTFNTNCPLPKTTDASNNLVSNSTNKVEPISNEFVNIVSFYKDLFKKVKADISNSTVFDKQKFSNDYKQLVDLSKSFIEKHSQSFEAKLALRYIAGSYKKLNELEELQNYLLVLANDKKMNALNGSAKRHLIDCYTSKKEYDSALLVADEIVKEQKDDLGLTIDALSTKGFIFEYYLNNKSKAESIYREVLNNYSKKAHFAKNRLSEMGFKVDSEHFSNQAMDETKLDMSNYPNPFNPTTKISFSLNESGRISLKVFDVLGKEVANLADGYFESGKHTATFDGSNLASGIYFYRLTTPTATITKKMVLTK